jgi:hypothetical protein
MIRHAASHGLSIFFTTVIASFTVELIKPMFPDFVSKLNFYSLKIVNAINIPMPVEVMSVILVAVFFGLVWGIFFKVKFVKK